MAVKKIFLAALLLLLAGCAAVRQSGATVNDGLISNPTLGFFGFSFEMPDGFELYDPDAEAAEERSELQQLAIRIQDLNDSFHPAANENFYESFLMLSENTAFLLVTVVNDRFTSSNLDWMDSDISMQRQLFPMYNSVSPERMTLGENRLTALKFSGQAYERKGWYYSGPKRGRTEFSYEACRVQGVNRDQYILMGFSLPEHKHILSLQMQDMVHGFRL